MIFPSLFCAPPSPIPKSVLPRLVTTLPPVPNDVSRSPAAALAPPIATRPAITTPITPAVDRPTGFQCRERREPRQNPVPSSSRTNARRETLIPHLRFYAPPPPPTHVVFHMRAGRPNKKRRGHKPAPSLPAPPGFFP